MTSEIIKNQDLRAASFLPLKKTHIQVEIIVNLLVNSIKNEKPITEKDIISAYIDWRIAHGKKLIKRIYNGWEWKLNGHNGEWTYFEVSKDEFAELYKTPGLARHWFKVNLGAAIIQGKILAIPVIEL